MKKIELQNRLIEEIRKTKELISSEEINNYIYHTFYNSRFYSLLIFKKSQSKPFYFKAHETLEKLNSFLADHKIRVQDIVEKENQRKESIKKQQDTIQKGSILYASWGYEQTNINFYLVIERRKSTLVLQEIGQKRIYEHQDSGTCTPDTSFLKGEPFERRLTKYAGVKINDVYDASIYQGEKLYWSSYY